jgi:hypothetical protein
MKIYKNPNNLFVSSIKSVGGLFSKFTVFDEGLLLPSLDFSRVTGEADVFLVTGNKYISLLGSG